MENKILLENRQDKIEDDTHKPAEPVCVDDHDKQLIETNFWIAAVEILLTG